MPRAAGLALFCLTHTPTPRNFKPPASRRRPCPWRPTASALSTAWGRWCVQRAGHAGGRVRARSAAPACTGSLSLANRPHTCHQPAQVYEHPQNVLLVKLLNGNLDLLAVHREGGGEGASAEATAQAQLGRSLRLWLDLQNSLNALIDSNAGALGAPRTLRWARCPPRRRHARCTAPHPHPCLTPVLASHRAGRPPTPPTPASSITPPQPRRHTALTASSSSWRRRRVCSAKT